MNFPSRMLTLSSLLAVIGLTLQAQTPPAAGRIGDCPDAGCCWDRQLNARKNLLTAPQEQPQPLTLGVEEIKKYDYPPRWIVGQSRAELKDLGEGRYVSVDAYLIDAAWGELNPASCNRPEPENINIRLSLVSKDDLGLKRPLWALTSVTAEVTPRARARNAQWKENLENLIYNGDRNKFLVRVKGLMLLDTGRMYSPRNRATDWEIHPVLDIEVCMKGDCGADEVGWKKLGEVKIPKLPPHRKALTHKKRRGIVIKN